MSVIITISTSDDQPYDQQSTPYDVMSIIEAEPCQMWGTCMCAEVKPLPVVLLPGIRGDVRSEKSFLFLSCIPRITPLESWKKTGSPYMPTFPSAFAVNGACADVPVRMKIQSISSARQQCHSTHPQVWVTSHDTWVPLSRLLYYDDPLNGWAVITALC